MALKKEWIIPYPGQGFYVHPQTSHDISWCKRESKLILKFKAALESKSFPCTLIESLYLSLNILKRLTLF